MCGLKVDSCNINELRVPGNLLHNVPTFSLNKDYWVIYYCIVSNREIGLLLYKSIYRK